MLGYKDSLNYQYLRKQILDLNSDAQEEKAKEFTTRKKRFLAKAPGLISRSSASATFFIILGSIMRCGKFKNWPTVLCDLDWL